MVLRPAPIVLFAYNRPWHIRRTVESLQKNDLADQSDLVIYSDGPKGPQDSQKVEDVRKYIHEIGGFRRVEIVERRTNLGLAQSITTGVTEALRENDRAVVLEDDLVTSPFFLRYMNDALRLYEDNEKVISIHGYVYPVSGKLPTTFFLRGADCWGWATWKRGWELFEKNGRVLLAELKKRKLTRAFDFNGAYGYTRMLKRQISGKNDSWAVRWHASAFLRGRLTLYPGVSLVRHIGSDGSSAHCRVFDPLLDGEVAKEPIDVRPIDVVENSHARRKVELFLRSLKISSLRRKARSAKAAFARIVENLRR